MFGKLLVFERSNVARPYPWTLWLAAAVLLASCAPGPYNPDGQAAGVAMMQSGLLMMQPAYAVPHVRQSACHWFGNQWVCSSY